MGNVIDLLTPGYWKNRKATRDFDTARKEYITRQLRSRSGVREDSSGQGPLVNNDSYPLFDLLAYQTADAIDEASYREMQRRVYVLYKSHPLVHGWIETLVQFIVGDEFQMHSLDHDPRTQAVWDKHAENMAGPYATNPWPFPIFAQELVRRGLTFGEDFEREFVNEIDGSCVYRKMHPVWIYNPGAIYTGFAREWTPNMIATFGIQTDPEDIMRILTYYYDPYRNGRIRSVPGDRVIHTKIGDADMKRGEPIILCVIEYLIELEAILKARRKYHTERVNIAWVDTIPEGADPEVVKALMAELTISDPNGLNDGRLYANQAGSRALLSGLERKFSSPNLQAADGDIDVRRILQCIAVGLLEAYYQISGDGSAEDKAGITEMTFPAIRNRKGRQRYFGMMGFERIGSRVIKEAIDHGTLPEMSYQETKVVSKADPGIISKSREVVPRSTKFLCDFPEIQIRDPLAFANAMSILWGNKVVSKRQWQIDTGYNADEQNAQIELEQIEAGRDLTPSAMDELQASLKQNTDTGTNGNGKNGHGQGNRSDAKKIYRNAGNKS